MKTFWIILFFTVKSFSQTTLKINSILSFEKCNSKNVSLCGNYFEQDKMRSQVLIKLDKEKYIESYDTIYELSLEDSFKLERILEDKVTKKFMSKIKFPTTFYKIMKNGLLKNNLKEKPCKKIEFVNFLIKAEVKKIEDDYIFILNPFPKNFEDIFLKKRVVKYLITELMDYKLSPLFEE